MDDHSLVQRKTTHYQLADTATKTILMTDERSWVETAASVQGPEEPAHDDGDYDEQTTDAAKFGTAPSDRAAGSWSQPNLVPPLGPGDDSQREIIEDGDAVMDYRSQGGPILSYLWCRQADTNSSGAVEKKDNAVILMDNTPAHPPPPPPQLLTGQTLYLGSNVGCDGNIYCIPGNATRVLMIDRTTGGHAADLPANDRPEDHPLVVDDHHHDHNQDDRVEDMDQACLIGPHLPGPLKWLRGVRCRDVIYGLPCHAHHVLKIHVPTRTVSLLPIDYHGFYQHQQHHDDDDPLLAQQQQDQAWKYHGGATSPIDGCIYGIPQSAGHVLQIDPRTDTCRLVGPPVPGRYKWYGGVVGRTDGAIYGIPHNSAHILRILPTSSTPSSEVQVTLHGDFGEGGHKWHGAATAGNGTIVSVPANADTVLCITPALGSHDSLPTWQELGDATVVRTGRHRQDAKYKYLGAMAGTNGKVYCFPSGSEYVLQVDPAQGSVETIGPNLYDCERICQNKWQNGVMVRTLAPAGDGESPPSSSCVYGIPLAAESLLKIDLSHDPPHVTTWPLPAPYRGLAKWEGGLVAPDGSTIYTVPNNHKAVLRIETNALAPPRRRPAPSKPVVQCTTEEATNGIMDRANEFSPFSLSESNAILHSTQGEETSGSVSPESKGLANMGTTIPAESKPHETPDERSYPNPQDDPNLIYRSGIPTLRSSAHRVKYALKNRKHDPRPTDSLGKATDTLCLPPGICRTQVFAYDTSRYRIDAALVDLLRRCDPSVVGSFRDGSDRLEDFVVPVTSTWRLVNGGQCEEAQKYLSEAVAADESFLEAFDRLVRNAVLPYLKQRLVDAGVATENIATCFYYQRPPTLRLQPGPAWAQVKAHNDAEYGHQNGELNFWLPFTDRSLTGVDLWCESEFDLGDFQPVAARPGEIIAFHGSSCRHYVNNNSTKFTRVSMDFRVGVQGYFDPFWQMRGTTDNHGRCEARL